MFKLWYAVLFSLIGNKPLSTKYNINIQKIVTYHIPCLIHYTELKINKKYYSLIYGYYLRST